MAGAGSPMAQHMDDDAPFQVDGFFIGPSSIDSRAAVLGSEANPDFGLDQKPRPSQMTQFFSTTKRVESDSSQPPKQSHEPPPSPPDPYLALGAIRLRRAPEREDSSWYMVGSGQEVPHPHPLLSQGEKRQWIQTQFVPHVSCSVRASLRVSAFPEDVNRSTRGSLKDFRKVLKFLSAFIDMSPESWESRYAVDSPIRTYLSPAPTQEESLFYIFNTLSSPQPSVDGAGHCPHSQQAMSAIFGDDIPGLRTTLYPYQKRSVAAMLQKEANPATSLDPRKPQFRDMRGREFYFDVLEGVLLSNPYRYSEPRGGILAETMGYGKTLICIALILATRGHYPQIPEGRLDAFGDHNNRQTPSLLELAAKSLKRAAVPWKGYFAGLEQEGYSFDRCMEAIDKYDAEYAEPIYQPTMPNRSGKKREEFRLLRLCFTTLLIVPPNLLVQWQHEIEKHTEPGALDILALDSSTKEIPHCRELMKYDVVLITKARFEQEYRDDDQNQGRRMPGQDKFQSQLTEVRWLRVICDEGHGFAGSSYRTNAMAMLDKMSIRPGQQQTDR